MASISRSLVVTLGVNTVVVVSTVSALLQHTRHKSASYPQGVRLSKTQPTRGMGCTCSVREIPGADQNHESRIKMTNQNTQNHNYSESRQLT